MATRAKEFAKTTATVLGIIGAVSGAIIGGIATAHFAPLIIPGILLGAAIGGIWGALNGAIEGGIVGFFFKKKPSETGDNNQPATKVGRSAQITHAKEQASAPVQDQGPDAQPSTAYRDLVTSQAAATTRPQR